MTTPVPGSSVGHCVVDDSFTTEADRTDDFDDHLEHIRQRFLTASRAWPIGEGAKFHLLLTVERPE